jgi:predicted nucleic acid-binding protein
MAKNLIIVDSCVFIQAFRRNKKAQDDLKSIEGRVAYSIITQLELLTGANTPTKKETIIQIFESYYGILLNHPISITAIKLMEKYISGQKAISVPDCLIAATSIETGFPLLTYNTKDFSFIEEIKLYK